VNRFRAWIAVVTLGTLLSVPATALAQTLPPPPSGPVSDPAESAKVKIGPLFMNPNFGFRNVGLDNNVYNDPENPVQDWTATVTMGMLAGVRYGPMRFTYKTATDYVYFAEERSERAIDGASRIQLELRTDRFRPWIAKDAQKTHDRAGLEIDSRAGRELPAYEAGVETRFGFRLGTRLVVRQRKVDYEEQEEFRGLNLSQALNATYEDATLALLYEISPLSNFRFTGEVSRVRFETAKIRDSDDRAVFVGIEGKKDAALEGYVDVGWRERTARDPIAPSFKGIIARASASFVLWEEVLVAFGADRDLLWSYEELYTFYVQQGASTVITWRPHERFDIVGTGRRYQLVYDRGIDERAVLRTDTVFNYGAGVGFFIRGYPGTRLGVAVERSARESVLADRRFDTTRFLTNVGFSF
jgi:hypothetical protein